MMMQNCTVMLALFFMKAHTDTITDTYMSNEPLNKLELENDNEFYQFYSRKYSGN